MCPLLPKETLYKAVNHDKLKLNVIRAQAQICQLKSKLFVTLDDKKTICSIKRKIDHVLHQLDNDQSYNTGAALNLWENYFEVTPMDQPKAILLQGPKVS